MTSRRASSAMKGSAAFGPITPPWHSCVTSAVVVGSTRSTRLGCGMTVKVIVPTRDGVSGCHARVRWATIESMSPMDFDGKTVLITGGGAGIGRATAEAFGKAGAAVVVVERLEKLAVELRGSLNAFGVANDVVTADVTDPQSALALA